MSALRAACDPVGMPLTVEPLVMKPGAGGYGVDGAVERIVPLVRQAAERGADVIKADPTDDLLSDLEGIVDGSTGTRPSLRPAAASRPARATPAASSA
jgi:DhnA family fructose-bisphosphate aldolase class Ia